MTQWTSDMDDRLRKAWEAGQTANEIAKAFGLSRNAILGRGRRLALSARRSPITTKRQMFEQVVDFVTDFDVPLDMAAKQAHLDIKVARQFWAELCAQGGRQYA